ncbi:hypothetical protein BS47DRAFT_1481590 [Hydnum rufescens UP504]|uniref:DUF659 domain-containing protein n=1 Tax=Hydnum rufescens UP504 TaxID=1448309 RepID=A0A9P6BAD9_9AGAM|nr:hypothetical protein BS47DRAFT_1481590 [Hydnum rufescens UP504]
MGKASPLWKYFTKLQEQYGANKSHPAARCNACIAHLKLELERDDLNRITLGDLVVCRSEADIQTAAIAQSEPIQGSTEKLARHLVACVRVSDEARATGLQWNEEHKRPTRLSTVQQSVPGRSEESDTSPVFLQPPSLPRSRSTTPLGYRSVSPLPFSNQLVVPDSTRPLPKGHQNELEMQLTRAVVAAGWSFNSIENPEVVKLFRMLHPRFSPPSRTKLSGPLLKAQYDLIQDGLTGIMKGGYATGQCDGWKDISWNHVVAFMLRVTHVHNTSGEHKTAENLLKLMEMEKKFIEVDLGCTLIGWVSDAGGESRAARVRLHAQYPWLLIADCFVHQLVLGDYIKKNPDLSVRMAEASELVNWFNNHSFALHILFKEQRSMPDFHDEVLTLIRAVLTRWATHVVSFNRLLKVELPMKSAVIKWRGDILKAAGTTAPAISKANQIIKTIEDIGFWEKLRQYEITSHLEPLAIAINVCQGSHTRIDMVALVFGRLYKHYMDLSAIALLSGHTSPVDAILGSLDTRWTKVDQSMFIVGIALNPFLKTKLFNPSLSAHVLTTLIEKLYCRVFKHQSVPPRVSSRAFAYLTGQEDVFGIQGGDWTDEMLHLHIPDLCPLKAWKAIPETDPLAQLGHLLFSFVCTSAATEHFFSETGSTKTASHNRLSVQKMVMASAISLDLHRQHAEDSTTQKWVKRSFGIPASTTDNDPSGMRLDPNDAYENPLETESGYIAMRNSLLEALEADKDVPAAAPTPPLRYQRASIDGRKWTLKEVFNLTLDGPWNAYWFQGERNTMAETEVGDLMTRQANLDLDPTLTSTAGWTVNENPVTA